MTVIAPCCEEAGFAPLGDWPDRKPVPRAEAHNSFELAGLLTMGEPRVLRGAAGEWGLVQAGLAGQDALLDLLDRYAAQHTARIFAAPIEQGGRYFYNDDLTAAGFSVREAPLSGFLQQLRSGKLTESAYAGSLPTGHYFPGLEDAIDRALVTGHEQLFEMLWIGTPSRVAAHIDTYHNLATAVLGPRRFILFPPNQVDNLYVGPIDFTLAGQPLSLVDFHAPDIERFPRFAQAMEVAWEVVLEPGDTLYIPPLWWHHVESVAPVGVMLNHWWPGFANYADNPMNALKHALMSIASLSDSERAAWRDLFDHYVFDRAGEGPMAHLPPDRRGIADGVDSLSARRLRLELINALNR